MLQNEDDIVYRLEKRAEIRRQISSRKSVQEGKPDRISDLLEEAAAEIKSLREKTNHSLNTNLMKHSLQKMYVEVKPEEYEDILKKIRELKNSSEYISVDVAWHYDEVILINGIEYLISYDDSLGNLPMTVKRKIIYTND